MNTESDAIVYTLDLPPNGSQQPSLQLTILDKAHQDSHARILGYAFQNTEYSHKGQCLFCDSAKFDYSPYYEKIDLFFIDGARSL
jgi:hypothetical protein